MLGQPVKESTSARRFPAGSSARQSNVSHGYALRHRTARLEVRYKVMSLRALSTQYRKRRPDEGMADPDNEHMARMMLLTARRNIAQGAGTPRLQDFPLQAVRHEFNVHWGATCFVPSQSAFAAGYAQVIGIVLHRKGFANVMVFFLADDMGQVEAAWLSAFHSLRFKTPPGD